MRRTSQTAIDPAAPHRSPTCLVEPHVRPGGGVDDQGANGGCSAPAQRPAMALARLQKTSRSMLISELDQDPSRSEEPRWASSPHAINEFCPGCWSRPETRVREPGADTVRGNAFDEAAAGCLQGGMSPTASGPPGLFAATIHMAGSRASENRCCCAVVHCACEP